MHIFYGSNNVVEKAIYNSEEYFNVVKTVVMHYVEV